MNEEKLNLYQKLAKIRGIADVVVKSKKGFNYTYADVTDILARVKAGMVKYGISLIPLITPGTVSVAQQVTVNTKINKAGQTYDQTTTEYLVSGDMIFRWVEDETGEALDIPWTVVGAQADPSQAFGSGLTYCTRYFLTDYFQIPQVDSDVDAYRSKQKAAAEAEERAISASIIDEFDTTVRTYLADNPDKAEDVKAFISRYAKKGDYLSIKDPALAKKLVEDFAKAYLNKDEKPAKSKKVPAETPEKKEEE